jgi:protein tyrosine phosphatase (PTP) superfamily phosphohydrolase (DUF442 family)
MRIIGLLALLVFWGCSHHDEGAHAPQHESGITITKELTGNRWGAIYFSAQPVTSDFSVLKNNGFKTIINLRDKNEGDYKESTESSEVKRLGMNYYNIPFTMKMDMTDEYIEKVTSNVMKHRKEGKILIHCSSGNRVAIWLGGHFKKDHKFSNEKSLMLAKELGLNNSTAEEKLKAYLK